MLSVWVKTGALSLLILQAEHLNTAFHHRHEDVDYVWCSNHMTTSQQRPKPHPLLFSMTVTKSCTVYTSVYLLCSGFLYFNFFVSCKKVVMNSCIRCIMSYSKSHKSIPEGGLTTTFKSQRSFEGKSLHILKHSHTASHLSPSFCRAAKSETTRVQYCGQLHLLVYNLGELWIIH